MATDSLLPEQRMYQPFFDMVAPEGNWKGRIDTTAEAPADEQDFHLWCQMVMRAVAFYTGSSASIHEAASDRKEWQPRKVRVIAAGYYAAVGA